MPTPEQMAEYIIGRKAVAMLSRGYTAVRYAHKGNGYWVSINRNGADDVYGETPILALAAAYDALGLTYDECPVVEAYREALRPFAFLDAPLPPGLDDDETMDAAASVGDVRKARTLLEGR